MELVTKKLRDLKPYEKNPRRNDGAVDAVAESIRQCEYVAPIVVDENGVILAGLCRRKRMPGQYRQPAPFGHQGKDHRREQGVGCWR